jgi:hypothetical protein
MVANSAVLEHDTAELDEQALATAARRGTAVPVLPARRAPGFTPSPDGGDQAALLDYAAFVLEQEAAYCQQ